MQLSRQRLLHDTLRRYMRRQSWAHLDRLISKTRATDLAAVLSTFNEKEQHLVFQENQRGVNFDKLFGPYLTGAKRIVVTDPYLRMFHQQRNLMELLETISKVSGPEEEVAVHVVTVEDEFNGDRQTENFQKIVDACAGIGIQFSWAYDKTGTKHDRDIMTDHGWKIVLSRGLDVFQRFELNDAFSFTNRMQQHRQCKEFNVTFVKL